MQSREPPFHNSNAQPDAAKNLADIIAAVLAATPHKADPTISAKQFFAHGEAWLLDCEMRQLSPRLIELRRLILSKFRWWIEQQKPDNNTLAEHFAATAVNKAGIRQFLHYVTTGHTQAAGRWGNPRNITPVKPATVVLYHNYLRALCYWIVADGNLTSSPMENIAAPINRPDEVQPFTDAQIDAILAQAKCTKYPARDQAICYLLLDTGMRISELCALRYKDIDMQSYQIGIEGKGGKKRYVAFGTYTRKALWNYLRQRLPEPMTISSSPKAAPQPENPSPAAEPCK